jgi:hypothetical protein
MQKREFCYTLLPLLLLYFFKVQYRLKRKKQIHVLHWGLGPTLGKSWVLFDTSRRQVGYPWHSYGVSRVLFHSVAMYRITWWFYDVPWIFGDDNYSWNMLPAEVANVLQFWSVQVATLWDLFFLQASIQQLPGQGAQLESSRDAKDELSFQVFDSFPGPKIPDSKFGHWFRISLWSGESIHTYPHKKNRLAAR